MPPEPIRAAALFVDEAMRRVPCRDLTLPAHRKTTDAETIVDQRADIASGSGRGLRIWNLSHGGVSTSRLAASAKNGKISATGCGKPKFAFQLANFHAGLGLVERRKSSSWLQNSSMLSVNNAPIRTQRLTIS